MKEEQNLKALSQMILEDAKAQGATSAEVGLSVDVGFSVTARREAVETVEYHRDRGVDITVYFGQQKGSASSSDVSKKAIKDAVTAACHIAKYTGADPCTGLAEAELMAYDYPDLDLFHPWGLSVDEAISLALEGEAAAFGTDKKITNSEGTTITTHDTHQLYANSHGFIGYYPSSHHMMTTVLVASQGDQMQRDYEYTVARDPEELMSIKVVANKAVERTVRRLGGKRISTGQSPVLFENRLARGLIGSLIGAAKGGAIYRRASFLEGMLGEQILPEFIELKEIPHLKKALSSAPFDAEGVKTSDRYLVAQGKLQHYILDSYAARKLGMETTGNSGGVHNMTVQHQCIDLETMLRQMDRGLLVTELMGQGVNLVTGDYSRGASGYWVENGKIQYPVEEITVAGNLKDIFRKIVAVGNDIDQRGAVNTGSILIEEMSVAGD